MIPDEPPLVTNRLKVHNKKGDNVEIRNNKIYLLTKVNEWGRGAFILGHTRAQVCHISLTTLPALHTDILLRKTRAKRKN